MEERKISETWCRHILSILKRFVDEISLNGLRKSFYNCTDKKTYVCAVRDLIHYLKDRKMIDRETASELLEADFLKAIGSRVREVYLRDDEIVKAYTLIKEKWNDPNTIILFKFLVYTGHRLLHSVKALSNLDMRKIEIHGNVVVYPMSDVATGKEKRAYIALFPATFAEELKTFDRKYSYLTWQNRICPRRWKPPLNSRVDANAIRKWHMNFLIRHRVDSEIANFIQGRSNLSIGSAHYLNLRMRAIEAYSKIVDKFPI